MSRRARKQVAIMPAQTPRRKASGTSNRWLRHWRKISRAVAKWIAKHRPQTQPRRLRLRESVVLGEKRFVAVIEFEHQRFLIGGAAQSVQLLARLDSPSSAPSELFGDVLGTRHEVTQ